MPSIYNIVTIQNIDNEDFTFEYDRVAGNPPYTIKAGEVRKYPKFLAKHAVEKLIDKLLTKKDIKTSNKAMRNELADQIVVDEEGFEDAPKPTEAEALQTQIDKLNAPSELDAILKKRREAKKPEATKVRSLEVPPEKEKEDFEGLEAKKEPKPEPKPAEKPKEDPESIPLPTRERLYKYLADEKKITITKKIKKDFDTMSINELIKDFDYPLL